MNAHRPLELQLDQSRIPLPGLTSCGHRVIENRESFAARMGAGHQYCLPIKEIGQIRRHNSWSPISHSGCFHLAAGREGRKAQSIDDSVTELKAERAPSIAACFFNRITWSKSAEDETSTKS